MIRAICYANKKYSEALSLNIRTAVNQGADRVYSFSDKDIDREFLNTNKGILNQQRGNGYWIWKPYFIDKVMNESDDGDWIVYADAGLYYHQNIKHYIKQISMPAEKCIVVMPLLFDEGMYTKGDVFEALDCRNDKYAYSKMFSAGCILLHVSELSRYIVRKWLMLCQDRQLVTDLPSITDNYAEFIENRHDQSILSLLIKKNDCYIALDGLFSDIIKPKQRNKALCIYHHTRYGKWYKILLATTVRVFQMAWRKLGKLGKT